MRCRGAFLGLVLAALVACSPSPDTGPIPDTTPPAITTRIPDANVAVGGTVDSVLVAFSEPIAESSVGPQTVSLVDLEGRALNLTPQFLEQGKLLILRVPEAVEIPNTLRLTLNGLRDLAGNALPPTSWAWSVVPTGPNPWALDSRGNPYLLLAKQSSSSAEFIVKYWNGQGWTALPSPSGESRESGFPLSLLLDAQDRPLVAWVSYSSPNPRVLVRQWNGAAWESLPSPQDDPPKPLSAPRLIAGLGGKLWFSALEQTSATTWGFVIREWSGTSWNTLPSPDPARPSSVALEPDPSGQLYALWSKYQSGTQTTLTLSRLSNSSWEQVSSDTTTELLGNLEMRFGALGAAYVLNRTSEEDASCPQRSKLKVYRLAASQLTDLGLESSAYVNAEPSFAVDRSGRSVVLRRARGCWGQTGNALLLHRWEGSSWAALSAPVTASPDNLLAGLKANTQGDVVALWWDRREFRFAKLGQ